MKPGLAHICSKKANRSSGESSKALRSFTGWWNPWIEVFSTSRSCSKSARSWACSSAVMGRLFSGVHQLAERWKTVSYVNLVDEGRDNDLYPARRCADDRDPSAGDVDQLGRPPSRVVLHAPELLAARHVGDVRHRQHAGRGDEEASPDRRVAVRRAVVGRHEPDARSLVVHRRSDLDAEPHVAPQVETVDHVIEVALDLRLSREVLPPLPLLEELLREQVAVRVALGIEPGTGVAVPEPRSAHSVAGLEQSDGEPALRAAQYSW